VNGFFRKPTGPILLFDKRDWNIILVESGDNDGGIVPPSHGRDNFHAIHFGHRKSTTTSVIRLRCSRKEAQSSSAIGWPSPFEPSLTSTAVTIKKVLPFRVTCLGGRSA